MRVLAVEDEPGIARIVKRTLEEAGYVVTVAPDGGAAQEFLDEQRFGLIILDLLIPGIEDGGMGLCRMIRSRDVETPILMLTALDSPASIVRGLEVGADDYLTKPFNLSELVARVRALARRSGRHEVVKLKVGDVELSPATRQVGRNGQVVNLTAKEFAVLDYLVRNSGRIVGQSELLEQAWDYEYAGLSNVVETYIRYIRQKLARIGARDIIQTRRGSGYIIEVNS